MSKSEHFRAYDLDCEDTDVDPAPVSKIHTQRRIRIIKVVGSASEEEMRVACPLRDRWPTFDACLECASWRGYSLDPRGEDSFMSCGELDPPHPMPADACMRSRALRTRVSEVMSDPVCVRENVGFDELASLFVSKGISGAPVVDAEGKPVGVVSKTDIIEARAGRMAPSDLTVHELMTPVAVTLDDGASLAEAVSIMEAKRIHRIPVTSASGHVVGVITTLDVAKWLNTPTGGGFACPSGL